MFDSMLKDLNEQSKSFFSVPFCDLIHLMFIVCSYFGNV